MFGTFEPISAVLERLWEEPPIQPPPNPELIEEAQRIIRDPAYFIEKYLTIVYKDGNYGPFKLNEAQKRVYAKFIEQWRRPEKCVRLLIIKSRQQGISSLCRALCIWYTLTHGMSNNLIVAQDQGTLQKSFFSNLIQMVKGMKLTFDISALSATKISFGTMWPHGTVNGMWARTESKNRGSMYNFVHLTEVDIYKNWEEFWGDLQPTISDAKGTVVLIESTAQGKKALWNLYQQNRENNTQFKYEAVFLPWYETSEYSRPGADRPNLTEEQEAIWRLLPNLTEDQMRWYSTVESQMPSSIAMRHEYPTTIDDCFVQPKESDYTFFPEDLINDAVTRWTLKERPKINDKKTNVILGIDFALTHDHIAFVWRCGNVVTKIQNEDPPKDDTKALNLIAQIIKENPADRIYIDAGGIGGLAHDALRSRGVYIKPINFGSSADEPGLYHNKRAEMYGRAKAWLTKGGMIPNNEEFKRQLRMIRFMPYESKLQLEPKKDLPYSPDIADAFVLTFQQRVTNNPPVRLQYRPRGFMDETMEW